MGWAPARLPPPAAADTQPGRARGLPLSHGCCPCPPAQARIPRGPGGRKPPPGLSRAPTRPLGASSREDSGLSAPRLRWGGGRRGRLAGDLGTWLGCLPAADPLGARSPEPHMAPVPPPGSVLDSALLVGGLQALGRGEGSSGGGRLQFGPPFFLLTQNPLPFQPDGIRQVQASGGWPGVPRCTRSQPPALEAAGPCFWGNVGRPASLEKLERLKPRKDV